MPKPAGDGDYVQSLERGLVVIQAFADHTSALSLSEVAEITGLSRPTVRRMLLTLTRMGYVRCDGRGFALTPRVLNLGYAYLSSLNVTDVAQPYMEQLVEHTRESSSMAILDDTEIVYIARVPTKRIMSIMLAIGTRLPAYATSMGRVLLADLSEQDLDRYFARVEPRRLTPRTVTDEHQLRTILKEVSERGWALVDQELEDGVRSIAAPVRNASGQVIAALNSSSHAGRVPLETLRKSFLPSLVSTARRISADLGAPP
ncbi:MAG: helix-turn-helix domain-containing protein [Actinophytocola sp.]|nr:helix-turn-helix domain-containing protein [Actinophytocola sp.]